jgi:hypothetical protein
LKRLIYSFTAGDRIALLFFILIDLVFFWKYFFAGLIPIPADVIIGGYYPWLNEKWGYTVGVPVKNALMSDVVSLLYPWRLLAIESIKSGQLPLWDSTSFLGTSLVGNFQAGIFNPFNLLFFLPLSFNRIWGLLVVIQPLIAMVSMYYFLKQWKVSRVSSILGSLSYAFSAQLLVWIEYNVHGFIISVFPLFMLFLDKFIKTGKIYYLSFVSLLTGYIILAGYPQHLYYFSLFGLTYLVYFSLTQKKYRKAVYSAIAFIVFVVLGLGLSSLSLIPGVESLSLSIKSLDRVAESNSVLYLPWQNLITAIVPDFFGNPASNNHYGIGYYESFSFYTSIVILPFAVIALSRIFKNIYVTIIALFLALTFILALDTPVSRMLQYFSFLGFTGSVSARVLFIYGFSISVLAALGLDKFRTEGLTEKIYLKYAVFAAAAGIISGILISAGFIEAVLGGFEMISADFGKLMISFRNSAIPLVLVSAGAAIIFLSNKNKIKGFLVLSVFALLLFDYFRFSSKYLPFTGENLIFPETPSIEFLNRQDMPFRIAVERGELLPANTWSVYGLESISGYNILLPRSTGDFINFLNTSEIKGGYSRFVDIGDLNSALLDASNVKYLLALLRKEGSPDPGGGTPYSIDESKYFKVFGDGPVAVYENRNYIPRFYAVKNVIPSKNSEESYSLIKEGLDFKESAVVENTGNAKGGPCEISDVVYGSQLSSFKSDCPGESFAVMSQLFYPGWKVFLNGKETEVYKTNAVFQGIKLPPGKSEIKTYYFPEIFRTGVGISFASLVVWALAGTLAFKKKWEI